MREVGYEVSDGWRAQDAPPPALPMPAAVSPYSRPRPAPLIDIDLDLVVPRRVDRHSPRRAGGTPSTSRDRRALFRRLSFALTAIVGAALFVALTDAGRAARPVTNGVTDIEAALSWAGFGIDQISVAGHRYTPDGDILDALDLARGRTWLSFHGVAARDRIERLPWVASATLTRTFPGRLDVRIAERTAFGIWEHEGRTRLIDRDGRTLSDLGRGATVQDLAHLPRFLGEGADKEAAAMASIVARHPALARRLAHYERVGGRRWTLHLDNRTALLLPPDREALMLGAVTDSARLMRMAQTPDQVIDLRAPGRVAVRSRSTPAAGVAPPRFANGGP